MFNFIKNIRRKRAAKKTIKLWKWLGKNLGKFKSEYPKFKYGLIPINECYLCQVCAGCANCPLNINNVMPCGSDNNPYRRWYNSGHMDICAIDEIILLCEQYYT